MLFKQQMIDVKEIQETVFTPAVKVIPKDRLIVVKGKSRQDDPSLFFEQFTSLLNDCAEEFTSDITIDFHLEYINTSSSKWIFHILKDLQNKHALKTNIMVNWFYEDDDESIQEAGEVFQSLLRIPFNLISVDD